MTPLLLLAVAIGMLILTFHFVQQRGAMVRDAAWLACAGHLVFPYVFYWITMGYYQGTQGDYVWFFEIARRFTAVSNGWGWWQRVADLAMGDATRFMIALAMLVQQIQDSEILGTALVSAAGCIGQLFLIDATAQVFRDRRIVLAATLSPSLVFWTSSFAKESVALLGIGLMVSATVRYVMQNKLAPFRALFGLALIFASKPYLLFPMFGLVATWLVFSRGNARSASLQRPMVLLVMIASGVGLLALISRLLPQLSPENLVSEVDRLQGLAGGGSTVEGTRGANSYRMLIGLFNTLFRPQLFDVKNPLMLLSALEVTVATLACIWLLLARSSAVVYGTLKNPYLLGCVMFTVMCGAAVGATTLNLGTLSRYRVPLIPFFATWLAACFFDIRDATKSAQRPRPSNNASTIRF